MKSAVGFYANKPPRCLLQARSGPRSALSKQETTQVGGKLPGDERTEGGGPACTMLARCVSLRCGWHATPLSITCDDESHRRSHL